jgi:hypothetical protein
MDSDKFKPLKDNPGALINSDVEALEEYKIKRKKFLLEKEKKSEVENLKQDVDTIKNDLADLKNLLLKVLDKK